MEKRLQLSINFQVLEFKFKESEVIDYVALLAEINAFKAFANTNFPLPEKKPFVPYNKGTGYNQPKPQAPQFDATKLPQTVTINGKAAALVTGNKKAGGVWYGYKYENGVTQAGTPKYETKFINNLEDFNGVVAPVSVVPAVPATPSLTPVEVSDLFQDIENL